MPSLACAVLQYNNKHNKQSVLNQKINKIPDAIAVLYGAICSLLPDSFDNRVRELQD